jgi:hypothetical protein
VTHIDPFAPADSPAHPANWGVDPTARRRPADLAEDDREEFDALADLYPLPDGTSLEDFREYHDLFALYSTGPESDWNAAGGDGGGYPTLADLHARDSEHSLLLEQYGTDAERAAATYPHLEELRHRAQLAHAAGHATEVPDQTPVDAPAEGEDGDLLERDDNGTVQRPHKDARKAVWQAYAQHLDADLTEADVASLKVAELKELTANLEQADR